MPQVKELTAPCPTIEVAQPLKTLASVALFVLGFCEFSVGTTETHLLPSQRRHPVGLAAYIPL